MKTLWLTYAWLDNEENDVDFVVSKLQSLGIEVRLDRTRIVAGRRLWQQIDNNIQSQDLDGFAIYTTKQSLESEPCQEEIVYALDRVLRTKGASFPLIGIFPTPMDRVRIPSAIATRLYVSLKDETWAAQIKNALSGQPTSKSFDAAPFFYKEHLSPDGYVYEMRPRDGVWQPAVIAVPSEQLDQCSMPFVWAKGQPNYRPPFYVIGDLEEKTDPKGNKWRGYFIDQQADPYQSVYLPTKVKLKRLTFGGSRQDQQYSINV